MVMETTGTPGALPQDTVDILETNLDDVSGEVIGEALARFMAAGARDASATPILMKKGRPGYLVAVIASPEKSAALARLMARELGTLGIRCIPAIHRFIAERTTAEVDVEIPGIQETHPGEMRVDRRPHLYITRPSLMPHVNWAAELDLPVRDMLRAAQKAAEKQADKLQPRERSG